MQFTDRNGESFTDIVHCNPCGFGSTDLNLTRCPRDEKVLGEISVRTIELPSWTGTPLFNFPIDA
jgi:hypothetical protein